ncbi:MAG: DNA polymerase I [Candidatus Moranbacteria bacterium]|nr:DNA polymerase I [Candidatus Moranbacteria bacterium]
MENNKETPVKSEEILRGKKLILIDGNAIIHRAYHALPPFTTKQGELVNAVYGFASTLLSVIAEFQPDYVVASFDLADKTFRHSKFEDYKANRVKGDDELYAQIPRVKEVVKAFNIPIYEQAGFEADDIIGTIATQIKKNNDTIETIIVTGDMDTLQLVNDTTNVYTMKRGLSDSIMYDEKKVFERYGLKPKQIIDFKALRGDPSDNIPGVKGIGEKTAVTLLQKYETLDGVYESIGEIKGAVKEKLLRDKVRAYLSKELATISLDAPVSLELEKAVLKDFKRETIVQLFSELNFFSLIKRLPGSSTTPLNLDAEKESSSAEDGGVKDFKYFIIEEKNKTEILEEINKATEISIAVETFEEIISGISISWKTGRAAYFPNTEKFLLNLKDILENSTQIKVGYDLKTVYKQLKNIGINLNLGGFPPKGKPVLGWDTMLAAYVLNPGRKLEIEKIIFSELGEEISFEKKLRGQLSLVINPEEEKNAKLLVCQKADYALKLKAPLEKRILEISAKQKKNDETDGTLETIFSQMEMPLLKVLAEMELRGIRLNPIIFQGISEKITKTIHNLEKSIHELAGRNFNINSPSQLSEILFSVMGLSTADIKKTKKGLSTASAELEKLRPSHHIIEKIEQYRELFKLKTTYLDAIPKLLDENSRIHTTFQQAVTATGRLSSIQPNLQNIPIKTELGQFLRTAFTASDGYKLIGADYSQIDLRCVAHVSNDKKMIEAFHRGDDIHKITASQINNVTLSQVTEKMRSAAKALNFGIIYGMSSFGFSQSAGIARGDAQNFINSYMEKFSGVASYMKETREFARANGYVETLLGRRRNLPEINSPNFQVAAVAERMAINMPIQGLTADIMKLAMLAVAKEFSQDSDLKMLLQIHDEIILEVKTEKTESVAKKIKEIMENVYKLKVPLTVDVKVGDNWGEI